MTPPFFGTKIIENKTIYDIEPFFDKEALFATRWKYRHGQDDLAWTKLKEETVIPTYEKMLALCKIKLLIQPKIVYGYFACRKDGNGLIVDDEGKFCRFDFPREKTVPHRCLADYFSQGFVIFQMVTIGDGANAYCNNLFSKNSYNEVFLLKGLLSEATEATAKYCHTHILKELGVPEDIGQRFSPGYPTFPNLIDQKKISTLLKPMRIGIKLTKTCMLVPEHSTSAIVSIDKNVTHFRP